MLHGLPRPNSCRRYVLMLVIVCTCCVSRVHAVVLGEGDGSQNVTAPMDDPGFHNVVFRGGGTAVYLGNRWLLTASHVGAGSIIVDDQELPNIVDQTVRITNDDIDGLSGNTDLLLFRLAEDPGLPALHLGCDPVSTSSEVLMIGSGRDRVAEPSFWSVEVHPGDDDDVWTIVESETEANRTGFETLSSRSIRWGKNIVHQSKIDAESGHGDVRSFSTTFDPIFQVDSLAQGVRGDSGGAVFEKNNDVWELVGVMHAIDMEENQPGSIDTAVHGNITYVADLFAYAETIRAIADFEPEAGDIDGDGIYTVNDIDRMLGAIQTQNSSCHFDLTGDLLAQTDDLETLLGLAGSLTGDANLDGMVQFDDFLSLARAFNTSNGGWANGDFDGDGSTTFADFLALSRNFGESFQPESAQPHFAANDAISMTPDQQVASQSAPEPTAWILLSTSLLFMRQLCAAPRGWSMPKQSWQFSASGRR